MHFCMAQQSLLGCACIASWSLYVHLYKYLLQRDKHTSASLKYKNATRVRILNFRLSCSVRGSFAFVQIMEMGNNTDCYGCGRSGHWIKNCPGASGSRARGSRGPRGRGKGTIFFFGHDPLNVIKTITWGSACISIVTGPCLFRTVLLPVWRPGTHGQGM